MTNQPEFDLAAALVEAEDGITLTSMSNAQWLDKARRIAWSWASAYGSVTTDDLRPMLPPPKSSHAWGAIFRGSEWRCIGWVRSELVSNHGRSIRKWALA